MLPICPNKACKNKISRPKSGQNPDLGAHVVRHGRFLRSSESRLIARFRCKRCLRTFSTATTDPCFRQQKRRVNEPLRKLLVSGISMRRAAWLLKIRFTTVARKLKFLASLERKSHQEFLQSFSQKKISILFFDEMETFEHTKCKPLSLPIAVEPLKRKILGIDVASMPAKGLLAARARKKYGLRVDKRGLSIENLFKSLKPILSSDLAIHSDQNPHYPPHVRKIIPGAKHITTPGRRGCIVGQGELKAGGFDPLFSLNHTCAMIRANVNRTFRRTWCTTKKPEALLDHLMLYVGHHNRVLTA